MKRILYLLLAVVLLPIPLLYQANRKECAKAQSEPDVEGISFTLPTATGGTVSFTDFKDRRAIVVVFIGGVCPLAIACLNPLKELHDEFGSQGVPFLVINSNFSDSMESLADLVAEHRLPFPVLKDDGQRVADLFKARRTPEAFILDADGGIRYQGRIDRASTGDDSGKPGRGDLAEALVEVLAGRSVTRPRTEAVGCLIVRDPVLESGPVLSDKTVTYSNQVVRIMQKNCQECHRPGQIGPFSLMTYEQTRKRSESIRAAVEERRMPPWHADPRHGKFSNDRSLSPQDIQTLMAWVERGCPKGDDRDLPVEKSFEEGWSIGKPDAILSMSEAFEIPAKGPPAGIPYQQYTLPTSFGQDVWVRRAQVRPGSREVVHHARVLIGSVKKGPKDVTFVDTDALTSYVPGGQSTELPSEVAWKLPRNSNLFLEMHYTANGIALRDRTSIGLILSREAPQHEARSRYIFDKQFVIPPGDANYKVVTSARFDKAVVVLDMIPHMHLRGKSFEFRANYPDGRSQILLLVPRYDFHWQTTYRLQEPLHLPAGTTIVCMAHFDNSTENPNNPDAGKEVRWGDQSWEEMMLGRMTYYCPDEGADRR